MDNNTCQREPSPGHLASRIWNYQGKEIEGLWIHNIKLDLQSKARTSCVVWESRNVAFLRKRKGKSTSGPWISDGFQEPQKQWCGANHWSLRHYLFYTIKRLRFLRQLHSSNFTVNQGFIQNKIKVGYFNHLSRTHFWRKTMGKALVKEKTVTPPQIYASYKPTLSCGWVLLCFQ